MAVGGKAVMGGWRGGMWPESTGLAGVARPLCSLWGDRPTPHTPGRAGWETEEGVVRNGPGDGLAPTWVVASDPCGTAEDLPQQRGVLSTVLGEHVLQGLCPVELIEDDGGCGGKWGAGVGSI